MPVSLCIHGHFYQPPREDPWLGAILAEPSAAPMRNWNERITRESYAPLAWARRLDAEGKIADLLNCYEWMSFNAGPTLLRWMQQAFPRVLERMVEGDARSRERWGHGNAMAQIYHHVIMPLATPEDRAIETRWAIDDFRRYFGREPEGMWLSECAVDLPTLENLAEQGIRFVILAPRQAKAVVQNGVAVPVNEGSLNIGEPYRVALPSGKSMTAVFYHGGLSQAIAFEGLLRNGESFWQRIAGEAANMSFGKPDPTLLTLATDGETYGHHFTFGEMALAWVLAQGAGGRDNIRLTNLPAYIAANPPAREALIHEPSSWSCVHGVERWRSDCGCTDGGHHGWNQQWRGPLRASLDIVREAVRGHFHAAGQACFTDPEGALTAYGEVLADPEKTGAFADRWFKGDDAARDTAWNLLTMQEQSLAAYASCAWFFDDIARIEPENAMTFALRAMELVQETGGPDIYEDFLKDLDAAVSNQNSKGTGRDVFLKDVALRRGNPAAQCLLALLLAGAEGRWPANGKTALYQWPKLSVEISSQDAPAQGALFPRPGTDGSLRGKAVIRQFFEEHGTEYFWEFTPPSDGDTGKFAPSSAVDVRETALALDERAKNFVSLRDASVELWPEGGTRAHSVVWMFSKPMLDYLMAQLAGSVEKGGRCQRQILARHQLSTIAPWPEEQHDIIHPDLYHGIMPYLALETVLAEDMDEACRTQAVNLIATHLGDNGSILAGRLVRETLKVRLAACIALNDGSGKSAEDAALAAMVRRARLVLPGIDLWEMQNMIWEAQTRALPQLTETLGFRG